MVYGIRETRQEHWVLNATRRFYYRLLDKLSEHPLPYDAGDFRLIDRRIIEELRKIKEHTPYLRGIIASLGFRQTGIPYHRDRRIAGHSKFNFRSLMSLAIDGILTHSVLPLRLATYCAILAFSISLLLGVFYTAERLFFHGLLWPRTQLTTPIVLLLLSINLNAMFFGIIGEYIGRIYKNSQNSPLSIIDQTIDHSGPPDAPGDASDNST